MIKSFVALAFLCLGVLNPQGGVAVLEEELAACSIKASTSTYTLPLNWDRGLEAYTVDQSLFLYGKISDSEIVVLKWREGRLLGETFLGAQELSQYKAYDCAYDHKRNLFLFFKNTARGGGPAKIFRYDIEDRSLSFFAEEAGGPFFKIYHLRRLDILILEGVGYCRLVGRDPQTVSFCEKLEGSGQYTYWAANDEAVAFNNNGGLWEYDPAGRTQLWPERSESLIVEMVGISDYWLAATSSSRGGTIAREVRILSKEKKQIASKLVSGVPFELTRALRSWGEFGGFAIDRNPQSIILVVGKKFYYPSLPENLPSWDCAPGYSKDTIILKHSNGYSAVSFSFP